MEWYPNRKEELNRLLGELLKEKNPQEQDFKIHGLIVPHAGYAFSGKIAGKAFSMLQKADNIKAIILAPSHYAPLRGIVTHEKEYWETVMGKIKIAKSNFKKINICNEHAIDNQVPFLQKLGFKEILPLIVGDMSLEEAKDLANLIKSQDGIFIFSSDLSHFLEQEQALKKDNATIEILSSLNLEKALEIDACGAYPLLVYMNLCKLKSWTPKLIEYKTSGDVTGVKDSVVGYASFYF